MGRDSAARIPRRSRCFRSTASTGIAGSTPRAFTSTAADWLAWRQITSPSSRASGGRSRRSGSRRAHNPLRLGDPSLLYGLLELISEDFQHDRLYGTVRAINPL